MLGLHQNDITETVAFAKKQGIKAIVEKYNLDQVQEAFDKMRSGQARFRSVVVF